MRLIVLLTVLLTVLAACSTTVAGEAPWGGWVHVTAVSRYTGALGPATRHTDQPAQSSYNVTFHSIPCTVKDTIPVQAAACQYPLETLKQHRGILQRLVSPAHSRGRMFRERQPLAASTEIEASIVHHYQQSQVVLVNDLPGHYEVLAGLIHLLDTSGVHYTTLHAGSDSFMKRSGFVAWLNHTHQPAAPARFQRTDGSRGSYSTPKNGRLISLDAKKGAKKGEVSIPAGLQGDIVICVSPELGKNECRLVVSKVQPRLLVMFIHRADLVSFRSGPLHMPGVRRSMVALAPHVADACRARSKQDVPWMLPTAPFSINESQQCKSRSCFKGFVIQGTIRSYSNRLSKGLIRNYTALWTDMLHIVEQEDPEAPPDHTGTLRQLRIKVLGKGVSSKLGIPNALERYVVHLTDLPYPEFWRQIHHSLALLPCFGMEEYYRSRLSSTIIASIVTSTPLIADQRLLKAYSFLKAKHVFLRRDDENEAQAMLRVLAMPEAELFSRRAALQQLRQQLNAKSRQLLSSWLQSAPQAAPQ